MMKRYRLYDYDVWGNEEDGWEVNDVFKTDNIAALNPKWSDKEIIKALKTQSIIVSEVDEKKVEIEGDEDRLYFSYKGRPEFEMRLEERSNPGTKWHKEKARDWHRSTMKEGVTTGRKLYAQGRLDSHVESVEKSEELGINPKRFGRRQLRNNPDATEIYDRITSIEAKKGKGSLWPGEHFRHDFKHGGRIIGLANGDLLIKKRKGKRLWKNFNY